MIGKLQYVKYRFKYCPAMAVYSNVQGISAWAKICVSSGSVASPWRLFLLFGQVVPSANINGWEQTLWFACKLRTKHLIVCCDILVHRGLCMFVLLALSVHNNNIDSHLWCLCHVYIAASYVQWVLTMSGWITDHNSLEPSKLVNTRLTWLLYMWDGFTLKNIGNIDKNIAFSTENG